MKYLLYLSKTERFIDGGIRKMTGTAGQQRVPLTFIQEFIIPVPPLMEQNRIVNKLDTYLSLCEELRNLRRYVCSP